ncbi:MAG TPA: 50S ribosomal protein L17 [Bacteroidia bacterium]|nr:50S ribosomal protein L17 [Bacteroidia bacterium]
MRHGDKINNLGRTAAHRQALMSNMACALIENKRIFTTLAKAKALRTYVEPLITKSKSDTTHSRRTAFSYLKSKDAVNTLFKDVAVKVAERNGGYTRIIKTGNRQGDAAEMAMIELVDFNEIYKKAGKDSSAKKTTRRGRAKKTSTGKAESPASEESGAAE